MGGRDTLWVAVSEDMDPDDCLAREAWERATNGPWAEALGDALRTTAAIARAERPFAGSDSLWTRFRGRGAQSWG
ncbi:MAG: hypothetical protein ACQEXJ_11660 [Myxococcota bacterium]